MLECDICHQKRINRNQTYLTVTVHNAGRDTEFKICGPRCFANYAGSSGLIVRPGVGY